MMVEQDQTDHPIGWVLPIEAMISGANLDGVEMTVVIA